jgi:hypothetical protein
MTKAVSPTTGSTKTSAPEQQKAASGDESYEESSKLADARKTVDEFDNKDYDIYKSGAGEEQRKDAAQQLKNTPL